MKRVIFILTSIKRKPFGNISGVISLRSGLDLVGDKGGAGDLTMPFDSASTSSDFSLNSLSLLSKSGQDFSLVGDVALRVCAISLRARSRNSACLSSSD